VIEHDAEYTVDELARAAKTTVRNIRSYQDKGLLPPPALRGRKGFYNSQHLSRLKVISSLLERGYTLSSIKDLLQALEEGIGLAEILGIETALASPWSSEEPQLISLCDLIQMFGTHLTPEAMRKANELGLFQQQGDKIRVSSMQTLNAGVALTATGIPLEDLLEILRSMRANVERVADNLVQLVSDKVLGQYGERGIPPKEDFPKIAELIWRLRPLAEMAVKAELALAMEKSVNRFLGDKLVQIMQTMEKHEK
jgi:DNA-binding transcriptional MerR regulator